MVLLVQIEVRLPSEGFPTLCALVGLLSGVIPDVLFEMGGVLESLPTVVAFVGSLSSVCPFVGNEVAAPAVCLPTLVTLVRSLPGVNPHVYLQGGEGSEGISTLAAVKGLLREVSSRVAPEGRGVVEGLPAGLALIGLLPRVYSPVSCEGRARGEGFLALVTFVHFPPIVNAHMLGEMGPVLESGPTVPAVIGPLASAPSHLLGKRRAHAEDFKQVGVLAGFLSKMSSFLHYHTAGGFLPKNIFHEDGPFAFRWSLPIRRCGSVKCPLLGLRLLFLLQVGDEAGFAHLIPHRGEVAVVLQHHIFV